MRAALTIAASVALSIVACGPPASELPPTEVLRYGVGHRSGHAHLVVRADGTAEYTSNFHSEGGAELVVHARVTREEIDALAQELRDNDFCSMSGGRGEGVPDEAMPAISVRLPGLDCRVEMWDREFREDPAAMHCLRLVESFARGLTEAP